MAKKKNIFREEVENTKQTEKLNEELLQEANEVLDADKKLIEQKEQTLMESKTPEIDKENLEKSKKFNKALRYIIKPAKKVK